MQKDERLANSAIDLNRLTNISEKITKRSLSHLYRILKQVINDSVIDPLHTKKIRQKEKSTLVHMFPDKT